MAKKYTRKQLRQPDEFIAFSQRAWTFVAENRRAVIIGASMTVVVIAGISLWLQLAERRAEKVTAALTSAVDVYNKMVIAPDDTDPTMAAIPADERFSSLTAKLTAAKTAFDGVVKEYGDAGVGEFAILLRASAEYDQGQYEAALADFSAFLKQSDHAELRRAAIEGAGYALEALQRWDDALREFQRLAQEAEAGKRGAQEARYHEARLLAKQGKTKEAIKQFKRLLDETESPGLVERAGQQLISLEG